VRHWPLSLAPAFLLLATLVAHPGAAHAESGGPLGGGDPLSGTVLGGTVLGGTVLGGTVMSGTVMSGTVTGRALDETGAVLPGVTVSLRASTTERTTVTTATGAYRFENVPAGRVTVRFALLNFAVVERTLIVDAGRPTTADGVMRLALSADVVVTGRATFRNVADVDAPSESLLGIAGAASQGAVTAAELAMRPIMRAGDVLETVPGLVVSQHSGEGKANQYYLRGFNLDHGTDFSTTVAGVPVNAPTGAHAHGYADANFLIPELVSGIQFKKGPYFAEEGDFSAAGAANVNYVSALDAPIASLSAGGNGWRRTLVAGSPRVGEGHLLGALELTQNDGPWVRGDHLRKANSVLRYGRGDTRNGYSVTGMGYWADWDSTDQVPSRAVGAGLLSRFGAVDPTDRGHTDRQTLAVELQRSGANHTTRASGYALRSGLSLFSNFTYFLDDPVHGDQFEQTERRLATGGRVSHRRLGRFAGRHAETAVGVQVRRDWISPVGLYRTIGGTRTATTREDRVGQTLAGVYAQSEVQWSSTMRTTMGLRADVYRYDVASSLASNSGRGADGIASPKFGAVFGPWASTELYANAGMGFHSNDARGAVTRVDPSTGDDVVPVTPLVRARGAEIGVRTVRLRGVQSTVALWYLGLDSELLFVGDAGTTQSGRPSGRTGVEWSTDARLRPWLRADVDVSISRARFANEDAAGPRIPGSLGRVIAGGLTVEPSERFFGLHGSVRLRHVGPRPLTEDAGVTSGSTTLWNAEAGMRLSRRARVVVEGFNLLDADASDVDYFYRSRLPGEPAEGVEDVHTHAVPPRSVRVGLEVTF
jgi:hypothetical protein